MKKLLLLGTIVAGVALMGSPTTAEAGHGRSRSYRSYRYHYSPYRHYRHRSYYWRGGHHRGHHRRHYGHHYRRRHHRGFGLHIGGRRFSLGLHF